MTWKGEMKNGRFFLPSLSLCVSRQLCNITTLIGRYWIHTGLEKKKKNTKKVYKKRSVCWYKFTHRVCAFVCEFALSLLLLKRNFVLPSVWLSSLRAMLIPLLPARDRRLYLIAWSYFITWLWHNSPNVLNIVSTISVLPYAVTIHVKRWNHYI